MKTYCIILIVIGLAFPLIHATTTLVLQPDQAIEEEFNEPGFRIPDGTISAPEETIDSHDDKGSGVVFVALEPEARDAVISVFHATS